jgi:D-glycero-alpha-D-manno-heptose-7-phosphate kinase
MPEQIKPDRIIYSTAPIRICDIGGWTDTWFAEYGTIFNIAVSPHAEVQIDVYRRKAKEYQVTLFTENYGDRYAVPVGNGNYERHPLLEAAVEYMKIPDEYAIEITLYSDAPAGASIGTSASVTVALIGALDLLTSGRLTPHEMAYAAQYVETEMLKLQCGIQDQLAAAFGNISYIDMFKYPHSSVSHVQLPNSIWWELNRRLILIYLGQAHDSSKVHEKVIAGLEDSGPETAVLNSLLAIIGL